MNDTRLRLENISKSYLQGSNHIKVLNEINLEVPSNISTMSIVGKSGSGKSTLLNLLAGLDHPDSGEFYYFNRNRRSYSDHEWEKFRVNQISMVFQQYYLLETLTALENVILPLSLNKIPNAFQVATSYLEKVGLQNRMDHYPHQLSGGEAQRVAIARALAIKPKILLADEPSGNLDPETGAMVMDLFFNLIAEENFLFILVTHDFDLADKAQLKVAIENGKLIQLKK